MLNFPPLSRSAPVLLVLPLYQIKFAAEAIVLILRDQSHIRDRRSRDYLVYVPVANDLYSDLLAQFCFAIFRIIFCTSFISFQSRRKF